MASGLEQSSLGTSVARVLDLLNKKEMLESLNKSAYSKEDIKLFKKHVKSWYNVLEEFGKNKVYPQSSVFWRILTYIPYINRATGFESYEQLGRNAYKKEFKDLKEFLRKEIPKQIHKLSEQIQNAQIANDVKRASCS